jgi:hypothetical protein
MKELLEKYFNGKTSLEEEAALKDYFNSEDVDSELEVYKPLFVLFEQEKSICLGHEFDQRILESISASPKVRFLNYQYRQVLKVAAVLVLLVSAWLFYENPLKSSKREIDWSKYETNDPVLAWKQTRQAFALLSSKLNKAADETTQNIVKAETINKYLK